MMPRSWAAASPRAIWGGVIERLAYRERAVAQAIAEGLAFKQFHHDGAVVETVDLRNVGVIE